VFDTLSVVTLMFRISPQLHILYASAV